MTKEYLQREYKLAILDFKTAHNDADQWAARANMARLERIAADLYGFAFADSLALQKNNFSL